MPWVFDDSTPIYQQIIEQVKLRIAIGEYRAGDKLLPVRELASEAEVNPNTMQKALAELERDGLLYSQRTAGRFITENQNSIEGLKTSLAVERAKAYLSRMEMLGYDNRGALEELRKFIGG